MLKKIALLVVMFALPLGAMAQTKFAHMNSQEVIVTMPEYTKAQADLDAMSKEYQTEMQRTQEEFNKKYQEFLAQADSLPKNIAERRQKELQDMAQRQEQFFCKSNTLLKGFVHFPVSCNNVFSHFVLIIKRVNISAIQRFTICHSPDCPRIGRLAAPCFFFLSA